MGSDCRGEWRANRARGYTDAEIETIQSLTYESAVSDLRDLPREELEGYGYTGEQIDFIKAYDGEPLGDKEIPELSAPLTIALRVYDEAHQKLPCIIRGNGHQSL